MRGAFARRNALGAWLVPARGRARLVAGALLLLLVIAAASVVGSSRWRYDVQDRDNVRLGRTAEHSTGTDDLGRDRSVRVSYALLLALAGALAAAALATIMGACVGAGAAFAPRAVGKLMMYGSDLMLTLPWLFLLMIVRASLPLNLAPVASAVITFLLLGALGWPAFARINFARSRRMQSADWMLQARAAGLRPWSVTRSHVLPHLRPVLLAQFLLYVPICIAAEANLGALGLGISEPLPSWGSMLLAMRSTAMLSSTRWVYFAPILLVVVLLLLEMTAFQEEA